MKNESLTESTHEKKKFSPKKMLAIALAAGSVALPLAGCGDKATNASPNPTATKTELASPSPSTSIETSPTAEVDLSVYAADMEKYKEMGVSTFESLPLDERLAYSQYLIDLSVANGDYETTYGEGAYLNEYMVTPTPASLDSSGQDILNNYLYAEQVSYQQGGDSADGLFDITEGREVLSSMFYDVGNSKFVTRDYLDIISQQKSLDGPTGNNLKMTALDTSGLLNGVNSQGEKVQYKIITERDSRGIKAYEKYVYHEFKNYDGSDKAIWLIDAYSTISKNDLMKLGSVR